MNHTLDLTTEELHELHVTLVLRKGLLQDELKHAKTTDIADICNRQLERVSPLLYYVESVVREHHKKAA